MSHLYLALRNYFFVVILSLTLPVLSAVDQYVPGTEAVMRALAIRAEAIGFSSGINWPLDHDGQSPGKYPRDGFYMNGSSQIQTNCGNEAWSLFGALCSGFTTGPDVLEGLVLHYVNQGAYPRMSSQINLTEPGTSAYSKLAYIVKNLPKLQHFLYGGGGSLYQSRVWDKSDSVSSPPDPNTPENHINTGWVDNWSPLLPSQTASSSQSIYLSTLVSTVSQSARTVSTKFLFNIDQVIGSASITVYLSLTETENGAIACVIPADSLLHKVGSLSGQGAGVYITSFFPDNIPSYPSLNPLIPFRSWLKSDHNVGLSYIGNRAIYSCQFENPQISPPKPQCISGTCCPTTSTAPGQGTSSPPVNIQKNLSYIDNTQRSHFHTARDYAVAKSTSGCGPCGGGMDEQGSLLALSLDRIHRYADMGWHGSFGPGVFLSTDIQLTLDQATNTVRMFDPSLTAPIEFIDTLNDGNYTDGGFKAVFGLTTHDASGIKTSDEALMRTAKMTTHQKNIYTFELFSATTGINDSLLGRLKSIEDRNGNLITLTYVVANAQASEATLQYDRERLWQINNITDAYGKTVSFTWQRHVGQWVIATMVTPTTATVTYSYNLNSLVGVNRITYSDGTQANFSTSWDAASQHQKVLMNDAGAEDIHRNKTLFLTTGRTVTGGGTQTTSQAPNRIWQVINGSGEVSYRNQISSSSSSGAVYGLMVYEGGGNSSGSVMNLSFDVLGRIISQERATSFSFKGNEITASGWKLVSSYESDAEHRIAEEVSAAGPQTE